MEKEARKPYYKRWWFWVGIILILIAVWALLWGPLFAWGPKWGYEREEHSRAILYAKDKSVFSSISDIDQIMNNEEAFHGINYQRKVIVVFANSKYEWKSFFPYLPSGTGGAGLQTGNAVFINYPKITSHNYTMDGFIKHELSHTLLYQNSGLLNAYRMFKQFWLEEGIATYYGGPWDYYTSKEEYLAAFQAANLSVSDDPLVLYTGLRERGGKLSYTTYRYFFEYLSETHSPDKLQQFIGRYVKDPRKFEADFRSVFGITLADAVKAFDTHTFNKGSVDPAIVQSITDFESCARLYPVQESYPERCLTPDGRSFTKQY